MAKKYGKGAVALQPALDHVEPKPRRYQKRIRRVPVDKRTKSARRWRSLYAGYLAQAPKYERLCRTAASLSVEHELLDNALARGEPVDVDHLIRLAGSLSRLLSKLGIAPKPVSRSKWDEVLSAIRQVPA